VAARTAADPLDPSFETVGQRLRTLFDRAVSRAVDRMDRRPARRGDRRAVLMRIADARLRIPSEDYRATLRTLARETGSSVGRVVKYEQDLRRQVRAALADDPEVTLLLEMARSDPAGMERPIDEGLQRDLREVVERKFMAAFFSSSPEEQADLLTRLVAWCGSPAGDLVRGLYASLSRDQQDDLASATWSLAG
jgi:hypothetical protein